MPFPGDFAVPTPPEVSMKDSRKSIDVKWIMSQFEAEELTEAEKDLVTRIQTVGARSGGTISKADILKIASEYNADLIKSRNCTKQLLRLIVLIVVVALIALSLMFAAALVL